MLSLLLSRPVHTTLQCPSACISASQCVCGSPTVPPLPLLHVVSRTGVLFVSLPRLWPPLLLLAASARQQLHISPCITPGAASVSASVSVTISISLHRSSLVSSHSEALSLPPSDSGRVSASSCLSGPHSCPSLVLLRPWWALGHHRCHIVEPRLFASLRSFASMTVSSLQAGVVPCVLGA